MLVEKFTQHSKHSFSETQSVEMNLEKLHFFFFFYQFKFLYVYKADIAPVEKVQYNVVLSSRDTDGISLGCDTNRRDL